MVKGNCYHTDKFKSGLLFGNGNGMKQFGNGNGMFLLFPNTHLKKKKKKLKFQVLGDSR